MDEATLARLRQLVLDDPALIRRLQPVADRSGFTQAVAAAATQRGLVLTADEVEQALVEARRRWNRRWE